MSDVDVYLSEIVNVKVLTMVGIIVLVISNIITFIEILSHVHVVLSLLRIFVFISFFLSLLNHIHYIPCKNKKTF